MESTLHLVIRVSITILLLMVLAFAIAAGVAIWMGESSVMGFGQAAFYAGIVSFAIGALVVMPFQGVGGVGTGMSSDFMRQMTLGAAETDWNALHKQDQEHMRRSLPVGFCLGLAGILLAGAGITVTWITWSAG